MSNSAKKSPYNRSKTVQSTSTASERKPALSIIKDIQPDADAGRADANTPLKKKSALSWKDFKVNSRWPKSVGEKGSIPTTITAGSDRRSGKDFLEAGKKRLAGDTISEATAPEAQFIKSENEALKQLVAELSRVGGPTGESGIKKKP